MVTLRPATEDDAFAIAQVHVRSWQAGYIGILPDAYLRNLRPEDRATRYPFGPEFDGYSRTIVAEESETIQGFVTFGPSVDSDASELGEIFALYIEPERWGQRIGRQLISMARSNLALAGHSDALLWVLVGNERAHRFYLADGWTPDGHFREENVWDVDVKVCRYRRTLP